MTTIAILGGTGHEGGGLARRWARAGHDVIVGSRDPAKAAGFATTIGARGMGNLDAAKAGAVVVLTVPFSAQMATLAEVKDALTGKILIDVTVPLVPPKVARVQLPEKDSAVVAAQEFLGPSVKVVAAFQNVSAHALADPDHAVDCDVLICGDDKDAREVVVGLAQDAGMRGLHAGMLANAAAAEALTSVLIFMNQRYKVPGTGIKITGLPGAG